MLRQFNRFIILALIIGAALYVTLSNSEPATLKLGPTLQVQAYAGVIYIGVFALGCIAASLVALFFGFKSYLRERKLRAAERSRQAFFDLFVKARSYMASGELAAARDIWEQILRHDQDNVIARVELSRCLEQNGDLREALRVLDSTRMSSKLNLEVLFRAAELNRKLGNNTAARDNLALVLDASPNQFALEQARDLSEKMGHIDDALEYQYELEKSGSASDGLAQARVRLTFESILQQHRSDATLREALIPFVRKNPTFVPALDRLAEIEVALGNIDPAAELLVKAAKASGGAPSRWHKVCDLWLNTSTGDFKVRADRAVAAARSAAQSAKGLERVRAELFLARTMLVATRADDARQLLDTICALADRERVAMTPEMIQEHIHLQGLCLSRSGMIKETGPLWERLVDPSGTNPSSGSSSLVQSRSEPSPTLSTP